MISFKVIQDFLDRKLLISDTADIFHRSLIGLDIYSLRFLGDPASVEIDILHAHWISSSSCYKIGMTLVYLVTLYFTSMIGSCALGIVGL